MSVLRTVGGWCVLATLVGQSACVAPASTSAADPRDAAHAWRVRRAPYFDSTWGVDIVGVRLVSSGWMLQFKYRVTDPEKARTLLDSHAKPYLIDEASGAKLAVPALENIGELRQVSAPEPGRTYYVVFGNANKIVKRGNRVQIEIGRFVADNLIVE
ncbi:putative transmembrane protein [Burkholderia sp. H160]|nr:putative transmembrane protein [Burkholderia sp. H160]